MWLDLPKKHQNLKPYHSLAFQGKQKRNQGKGHNSTQAEQRRQYTTNNNSSIPATLIQQRYTLVYGVYVCTVLFTSIAPTDAPVSTGVRRRVHTCSLEETVASITKVKLAFCGPTATV